MLKIPRIDLQPTFPMDLEKIKGRALKKLLKQPVTVGGLLAFGVGAVLLKSLVPVAILGGLIGAGLYFWGKKKMPEIESDIVLDLVRENNDGQNEELLKIVRAYRAWGSPHYATALGKFSLLKSRIEKLIHVRGEPISEEAKKLDNLVDNVCIGVCEQFNAAIKNEAKLADAIVSGDTRKLDELVEQRRETLAPVVHAYKTLYDTYEGLAEKKHGTLAHKEVEKVPVPTTRIPKVDLEATINRLAADNDFSRRLHERIVQDTVDYEEVMEASGLMESE